MSDNRFYKSKWPPEDTSRNQRRKSLEKSSTSINNLLAYYESNSANGGVGASSSSDRLNATSSPDSGVLMVKPRHTRQRALSAGSTSSSDYSVGSDSVDEHFSITSGDLDDAKSSYTSTSTNTTSTTHKRSTLPSVGGGDRRRLAIVQMQTLQEAMSTTGTSSSDSSLRSRRGLSTNLAGLALVAPPDASSKTYTHLSPPATATIVMAGSKEDKEGGRQRATPKTRTPLSPPRPRTTTKGPVTPRLPQSSPASLPATTPTRPIPNPYEAQRAMLTPTSARGVDGHSALSSAFPSSTLPTPLITPEIGAGKEIHVPVAAPVVVSLAPAATQSRPPIQRGSTVATPPVEGPVHGVTASTVFDPVRTSGFVNYKPGLHATAGPLPPPPRLIDITSGLRTPPPPRPPRLHSPVPPKARTDLEAMKQALQLPPAVAAKLAKTSPPPTPVNASADNAPNPNQQDVGGSSKVLADSEDAGSTTSSLQPTLSTHRREGAFASSPHTPQAESSSQSSLSTSTVAPALPVSPSTPLPVSHSEPNPTRQPSLADDGDVPNVTVVSEEAQEENEESSSPTAEAIEQLTKEDREEREHSEHSGGEDALSASRSTSSSMLSKHQRRISWTGSTNFRRHSRTPSGNSSWRGGVSLEDNGHASPKLSRSLSLSTSRSSKSSHNTAPSPPPKSFRNSLTTGLKRFSTLPKSPSLSASRSSRESRRSSTGTHYSIQSSRTPSPQPTYSQRVRRKRIVDPNPSAMFCHEVYQQRTTAERCAVYVTKINELYCYDCGLSDWLFEMKYRRSNNAPRGPSSNPFVPKPRQTSRASMVSEATFPRRPDAVVATDLSSHGHSSGSHSDVGTPVTLASTLASSLPYPSLAAQSRQQSLRSASSLASAPPSASIRSLTNSSHGHSSIKTGFFASLGRKASLQVSTKRAPTLASLRSNNAGSLSDHGHGGHSGHGRNVLAKTPPVAIAKHDISRPIQITTNHSAPSGPRALHSSNPNRVQRSLTMMPPPKSVIVDRDEAIGRRPSLFSIVPTEPLLRGPNDGVGSAPSALPAIDLDGEFAAQVDKLHALVPHADRNILAGYLKRAGQDMLAIGQYLEDEKNGTLRYF